MQRAVDSTATVSGYADENEGVDASQPENGVEQSPVESVGRLPPDERFIGPPGEFVNELDHGSTLHQADTIEESAPQRGIRADPREPWLVRDRGVEQLAADSHWRQNCSGSRSG
jgi:hypothetical protein